MEGKERIGLIMKVRRRINAWKAYAAFVLAWFNTTSRWRERDKKRREKDEGRFALYITYIGSVQGHSGVGLHNAL